MNRLTRYDDDHQVLIEELIAVGAFEANRNHQGGQSVHMAYETALTAPDHDIRRLMATERSLRECIAEEFSHRELALN